MTQQPMPPVASEPEDDDEFPDPKRSWKRTGSLLGGWAGTWAAVAILGTLWSLLGLAQAAQEDPDENDDTAFSAARNFSRELFSLQNKDSASEFQCADYEGIDPDSLLADLDEFKNTDGSMPTVKSSVEELEGTKSKYLLDITIDIDGNPQPLAYAAYMKDEGSRHCVVRVERS